MISTVSHLPLSVASTDLDTTPMLLFSVVEALLVAIERLPRSITFAMSSLSSFVVLVGNSVNEEVGRIFCMDGVLQLNRARVSCVRSVSTIRTVGRWLPILFSAICPKFCVLGRADRGYV